jgi:hypothetical protein
MFSHKNYVKYLTVWPFKMPLATSENNDNLGASDLHQTFGY